MGGALVPHQLIIEPQKLDARLDTGVQLNHDQHELDALHCQGHHLHQSLEQSLLAPPLAPAELDTSGIIQIKWLGRFKVMREAK